MPTTATGGRQSSPDNRRKPWYFEREPRPGVSVIGDRLSTLAAGRR